MFVKEKTLNPYRLKLDLTNLADACEIVNSMMTLRKQFPVLERTCRYAHEALKSDCVKEYDYCLVVSRYDDGGYITFFNEDNKRYKTILLK